MQIDITSAILGFATITSWILSIWMYFEGKKTSSVEAEKKRALAERISDLAAMADSVAMQVNLIVEISRRESTSKDELRHLAVSVQYSLLNFRSQTLRELSHLKEWSMGSATKYIELPNTLADVQATPKNEATMEKIGNDTDHSKNSSDTIS